MATPYYADDLVELWHGDSLAVLAQLPSATASALITDPPYSSGGAMRSDRMTGPVAKYIQTGSGNAALGGFSGDNRDARGYAYWSALWLSEALRVTQPGGLALVYTDWRQLPTTTDALQSGGWVWRGIGHWHKRNARPNPGLRAEVEYIVWGSHGALADGTPCSRGLVDALGPRGTERQHITQKPIQVMTWLIEAAAGTAPVLDPFAGSGTTLLAAAQLGRRAIGVELDERHCEIAATRLANRQGDLFAALESP